MLHRELSIPVIRVPLENPDWSEDILLAFLPCKRANTPTSFVTDTHTPWDGSVVNH